MTLVPSACAAVLNAAGEPVGSEFDLVSRDPHRVAQLGERLDDRSGHRLAVRDVRRAGGLDLGQSLGGVLLDRGQEALERLLGLVAFVAVVLLSALLLVTTSFSSGEIAEHTVFT